MKCAILQPSYIPWRGYFHQIQKADVFVFYDDVQYDKHGWRNRNRIKTPQGSQWLTIPVFKKGNVERHREIREIAIDSLHPWKRKHLAAIEQSYKRTAYYDHFAPGLHSLYQQPSEALAEGVEARALGHNRVEVEIGASFDALCGDDDPRTALCAALEREPTSDLRQPRSPPR